MFGLFTGHFLNIILVKKTQRFNMYTWWDAEK